MDQDPKSADEVYHERLELMISWARSTGWVSDTIERLGLPKLTEWEGSIYYATSEENWRESVKRSVFVPDYTTLGKVNLFFSAEDEDQKGEAYYSAVNFFMFNQLAGERGITGVALTCQKKMTRIFDARTEEGDRFFADFGQQVTLLQKSFKDSGVVDGDRILPGSGFAGCIFWTLFFLLYPAVEGIHVSMNSRKAPLRNRSLQVLASVLRFPTKGFEVICKINS